jgi:catechol 2,3-dioxygenase-like lactoylglutathione lyase family enzyme
MSVAEYAVPTLPSRDLCETLAFYGRLGFVNAGDAPEVWDYMIIRRGTVELHFYRDPAIDPSSASTGCFVWVNDADALHAEWQGAGSWADPLTDGRLVPPTDTDYGVRTLAVVDPSGNEVRFGSGPH